jgi:Dockerin type I domain
VITAAGRAPVTFLNFEFVNIINTNGGGSITLNTASGVADALILTGTGQKAGTLSLNAGTPIAFTGVDSFTFNAGDLDDTATVTPFATPVLPWNVAVKIDGGTGTADRIIYNNVFGLRDTTLVTASGPQAGHIDSPGVTSALHSQLITFTNVEDLTLNANANEDERLTVNLRDSGVLDTANLLFDPVPANDDLQIVGLFDMVIDTDNYVGLTLNGRDGNDTFNLTPGPIPVFVDGGNPIGSTAGDTINLNPPGAFVIEPGPQNDEGGLNAVGRQRVSWDHIEEVSVTGGPGVFLGTNGDDDISIIARDSATHAGADGAQDFTVSLNDGLSILFLNTPTVFVDALGGDDDIVLRTPAPNNAVWDVDVLIAGGQAAAPTGVGQQGDVFELETPGTQTVSYSPTGIGTATIDIVTLSSVITIASFTSPVSGLPSSSGGVEQIVYQGLGGDDPLTLNGTAGSDVATINSDGTGTFRALLSPDFDFFGAGGVVVNGGTSTDRVIFNGTTANDVIDAQQVSATTVNTTVNGLTHTANGSEIIGINTLSGDDLIRIGVSDGLQTSNPAASNRFDVDAGDANARLIVQDLGLGDLNIQRQGPDGRSGSITIGSFKPVVYKNVRRVDITPIDSVTGGTGTTDKNGRILILPTDPLETNDSRLNAGQLARVGQNSTSPSIDPGAGTSPFEVNGDEDWYEFRPQATGTFAVKILFDKIANLANGRPGLPGDGDLALDIYDANGTPITSGVANLAGNSKTATFGATNDPAFPQFNRIYVRVRGATPNSINLYDFDSLDVAGSVNPGVGNADLLGPQVTNVQVNSVPSATYNLFNSKDADNSLLPTPLTNSLLISFRDLALRAPGFVYPALDPVTATTPGTYVLRGDASGIIAIASIMIEPGSNSPPGVGGLATAQVRLVFANPLPDDRFTLTISDNVKDPAGNKLDGESNAAEPNGGPIFPSGNTHAGGNFIARFTIDTRAELATYASGSVYVDTNGNYSFDPTNTDATHRDITYQMGFASDNIFAGNFVKAPAGIADGFDKLAAYGKVGTNFRWLIDVNSDGIVNASDVNVIQPLFAGVTSIDGMPVAGNFDGNAANGDEVALKVGSTWLLDKVGHNFVLETKLPGTNMVGLPIVGDFDNDGIDDLGSWADDKFYLNLSTLGPIDGTADRIFTFGFASVRERPVAGDFDGDGITDLGLWVPDRAGVAPSEAAEWYLFLSGGSAVGRGGIIGQGQTILDRLNSPTGVVFTPAPFGNDKFAQFGDEYGLPVPGNFDPPITSGQPNGSYTNTQLALDVNNDGVISPLDALLIINHLNSNTVAPTNSPFVQAPFVDVNGDGDCTAIDALLVINALNSRSTESVGSSEGEAAPADTVFAELGNETNADDTWMALLSANEHDGRKETLPAILLIKDPWEHW